MSCQALECVRSPNHPVAHLAFAGGWPLDIGAQTPRGGLDPEDREVEPVARIDGRRQRSGPRVDALLERMARHRSGLDRLEIAFGPDELARLRRVLAFACEARGARIPTRRRGPDLATPARAAP